MTPPALAVLVLTAGLPLQTVPDPAVARGQSATTDHLECGGKPYDCAMLRIEKGDFKGAIVSLQQVLASTPRDPRVLNLLGIALTGANRLEEAERRFREALKLDPDFQPARKNLAVNEFNQGRLEAAQRRFQEVLARIPDDEVAHLHLGEIHYARKQSALALPHYQQSGGRITANPAWVLHYASCLLDEGHTASAVSVLDGLSPEDGPSHFEAGVILGRRSAHADAARHFGLARSTYKDRYAAGYNQTLMLVEARDYEGAIRVADELFRADFKRGELYNLVARAYVGSGRIQQAYDALRTAARLEPSEEQNYLDLALICLDHENFDLGVEIVDVGLRYTPTARLHLYRGVLLVMQGFVEKAEGEFQRARKLGPEGPVPDVALAMAWMQSGNTSKAVDLLRARIKASPREAIILYMLGVALMRSGIEPGDDAAAEAVRAFEEAIRLDPELAGPPTELGKILLRRGETERAIQHLERAAALDPESPAPAYLLAQGYRRTGDITRAQALLARVSKLNAQGRGDDPDQQLKRIVLRLVREGAASPGAR